MGAWGTGPSDNDEARDWVIELSRDGDADFPASMLRVLDLGGPIDSWEYATGLAAAEVIAASCGRPVADLPEGVARWLERTQARADAPTVQMTLRVVDAILEQNAELREQRDEAGNSLAEWLTPLENVRRRLAEAGPLPGLGEGEHQPAESSSRRLDRLVMARDAAGSRTGAGAGAAETECTWRKVRGGLLFTIRDARGSLIASMTR